VINIFKSELLKLKRSRFLEIVMIIPIFFVCTGISNFIRYKSTFMKHNPSIWDPIYEQSALMYGLFLLPLLVTIIMAILVHIEKTDNNLRRIVSLPIKKSHIYICKFLAGSLLIFINIVVFIVIVVICGNLLKPANSSMPLYVIYRPILAYFSLLPVMAIQYYLSMKFSNVFISIGIGTIFSIPSVLVGITKFWIVFPWCYAFKAISATHTSMPIPTGILMYIIGIVTTIIVTLKGIKELNNKDIL